jgi:ParB-like chromosome segregation protein Spo0J
VEIIKLPISAIKPWEQNPKTHSDEQVKHIAESIKQFGMNDPIGIWSDENIVVEGHGRILALKSLGHAEVDCIRLDHLSDEERRAYALVHNQATLETPWDFDLLGAELDGIFDIDMSAFGFDLTDEEPLDLDDDSEPDRKDTNLIHCPKCGFEFGVDKL